MKTRYNTIIAKGTGGSQVIFAGALPGGAGAVSGDKPSQALQRIGLSTNIGKLGAKHSNKKSRVEARLFCIGCWFLRPSITRGYCGALPLIPSDERFDRPLSVG
jgi:hypothetical protein